MKLITILLACLLAACGGGGSDERTAERVFMYGDSLTASVLLEVKTVQRVQAALGAAADVHDFSVPATSTKEALSGDPRQLFTTLPEHVRSNRPEIVLILYGGNDTKDGAVDPQFESRLRQLVEASQAVGARVVLATLYRNAPYEFVIVQIDEVIRRIAVEMHCTLADVHALPPGGFVDGVHPDQAYSDARAAVLAAAVRPLL